MGAPDSRKSTEDDYITAASRVARLRVEYAAEWQWQRSKVNSDTAATQATIEKTNDELTIAEAHMRVLGWRLQHAQDKIE